MSQSSSALVGYCFNCNVNSPVLHLDNIRCAPLCVNCTVLVAGLNDGKSHTPEEERDITRQLMDKRRRNFPSDLSSNHGLEDGYRRCKLVGLANSEKWCTKCGCEWAIIFRKGSGTDYNYCEVCMERKYRN